MNTSVYVKPSIITSSAAVMAGDKEFKAMPIGFYNGLIQEGFERLALDTFFDERTANITLDGGLVYDLPPGCFNVKNIYVFTGDICNPSNSRKVYWKRNYYTQGKGFIANDTGGSNSPDPFFGNPTRGSHEYGNQLTVRMDEREVTNNLFYNFQMGNLMISSSCLSAGQKLHIEYNGTGCAIDEIPIIPVFLRTAMQDYVTEGALRARMANTEDPRRWQFLWSVYDKRLNQPYEGSWEKAEYMVKNMNSSQREELNMYLGRGGWASGF
jgi:hypothetical protein